MKVFVSLAACIAFAVLGCAADPVNRGSSPLIVAQAADTGQSGASAARPTSQNPTVREFELPPVPDFMLRKPAQPLTVEEMRRQADEAAEKARRARAAGGAGSTTSGADAESVGNNSSRQPVK